MRTFILIISILAALWLTTASQTAYAKQAQAAPSPEQQLLQRIYQLRMRLDQERMQAENEARNNVRLVSSNNGNRSIDAPTVSGLRQQTSAQLARFESQFQCLDVEVEANSGNTVVICGDNSGDITGSNVSAERDIVTVQGGQR